MGETEAKKLRRGWTTGACAAAATKAALAGLWGGRIPKTVAIVLPRGETPRFTIAHARTARGWAEAGIVKDAGDDPDVTHGALIVVRVTPGSGGIRFVAGEGVGTVTRPGLPLAVGEAAINPAPRAMMEAEINALAAAHGRARDIDITISVPGGEALAKRTWNPRLGIIGGLSILGTTGIVRPFSCSAWIAAIHRGVDVARAAGQSHVAGCTGATSEAALSARFGLPGHAMLDMGDFAGGLLKYLRRHPVERLSIGGGIGKISKLSQGAMDLHSARSQVDLDALARLARARGLGDTSGAATALGALELAGVGLAEAVARQALVRVSALLGDAVARRDVLIVDRSGGIIAEVSS
ncbi:MAG: cobalt-precorrin-5B (C(1))-methyltransferase [Paracoccaceae bacterium]